MRVAIRNERGANPWPLVVSAIVHLILVLLLIALRPAAPISAPPDDALDVEIIREALPTPDPQSTARSAPLPQGDAGTPSEPPQSPTPRIDAAPVVRPSQMLSDKTLSDRRSREAKQILAQLPSEERIE